MFTISQNDNILFANTSIQVEADLQKHFQAFTEGKEITLRELQEAVTKLGSLQGFREIEGLMEQLDPLGEFVESEIKKGTEKSTTYALEFGEYLDPEMNREQYLEGLIQDRMENTGESRKEAVRHVTLYFMKRSLGNLFSRS